MKKIIFLLTVISIAFSSCKNLVPYTDSLKKEHGWSNAQVKNHVQFFLSKEIALTRKYVSKPTDHIRGKIVTRHGEDFEEIYLKKGLRVKLAEITNNGSYIIQCEVEEGNTLTFGVNPNADNRYVLFASEWNDGLGKVHYNNEVFFTDNNDVCLLVDIRHKIKETNTYRNAGGVKVK